ncbi:Transcriptional repressor NrdR [subsurface metagenome]
MKCPYCLNNKTRVIDKRNIEELNSIRRRRECSGCGKRFTTYERIDLVGFSIIKKDGRRESFDRNKLILGLLKACEKRPIPRERIEKCAGEIEAALLNYEEREVPSSAIGKLVMEQLLGLDKVAYIRFASVYREFTDLKSFERELKTLKKN